MNSILQEQGSKKRDMILQVIISYISNHGYPPSIREISDLTGIGSTSTVHSHLVKMDKEGRIKLGGGPRMIQVVGYKFIKEE